MGGGAVSKATAALLSWKGPSPLRRHGDIIVTPYVAITAKTRRQTVPLPAEDQEHLKSWARRGRRGALVTVGRSRENFGALSFAWLEPEVRGVRYGLNTKVTAWLKEQGRVTMRLIPSKPGEKWACTVVVYRGKEAIGYLAPVRNA